MEDFQKLIDETERTYKPEYPYRKLDTKTLLVLYQVYLLWERRVVTNIVDRPDSKPEIVWKEVIRITANLDANALTTLYSIRPDTKPLEYLIRWKLEREEIRRELDRRSKPYKLGREMIRLEEKLWEPGNFNRLLAAARVDRIQTRRPRKEGPEDLQQVALEGVAKWLADERRTMTTIRQTIGRGIPPLPRELGFPVNDKPPWDVFFPDRFWKSVGHVLAHYLPRLKGKPDQAVSQAKKNNWKKWEALKRTGEEITLTEAKKLPREDQDPEALLEMKQARTRQGRLLRSLAKEDSQLYFALKKHNGNKAKAAKELGISRPTLYKRLQDAKKKISD